MQSRDIRRTEATQISNFELGTWDLELGAWNLELGIWTLDTGMDTGIWNRDIGTWNHDIPSDLEPGEALTGTEKITLTDKLFREETQQASGSTHIVDAAWTAQCGTTTFGASTPQCDQL